MLLAKLWQYASAPAKPPKSAPLPGLALVMKKLVGFVGAALCEAQAPKASAAQIDALKSIADFEGENFMSCLMD
jgi:hypothetical protein